MNPSEDYKIKPIYRINEYKTKIDPLNSYTMSLIEKGLSQDNTELSAQSVNWNIYIQVN